MSLYRFSNNPSGTAVTTLQASINSSVTTLTLAADVATLPSAASFDLLIGSELMHVGARSGVTLSSLTRAYGGTTAASHTAGDSIYNPLTVDGLLANPGPMTTSGDQLYLNSSLRPARLAAPADGAYILAWASGVPSWKLIYSTAAPTIASGFGTSPSISGVASAFAITVGTGGIDTMGTVNFNATFAAVPSCHANNRTTILLAQAAPSTTQVVITSATPFTAGDVIDVICLGRSL